MTLPEMPLLPCGVLVGSTFFGKTRMELWLHNSESMHSYARQYGQLCADQARAEERAAWVSAIDEAIVCTHTDIFNDGDDPREAMRKILAWNHTVSTDPLVSSDAAALIERGRAEERRRREKIAGFGNNYDNPMAAQYVADAIRKGEA